LLKKPRVGIMESNLVSWFWIKDPKRNEELIRRVIKSLSDVQFLAKGAPGQHITEATYINTNTLKT